MGVAVLAGALTGVIGGAFRFVVFDLAVRWQALLDWAREAPVVALAVPVVIAAVAVAGARTLVQWCPEAAGSGVPRVRAAVSGDAPADPARVVPAKLAGATLAIGSGMVLGSEGPTVQIAAAVGAQTGSRARLSESDVRTLQGALGGVGLGVAFTVPLAGMLFALEELDRSVRPRLLACLVVATPVAIISAYPFVGYSPLLPVSGLGLADWWHGFFFALLGLVMALIGTAYSRLIATSLRVVTRWRLHPVAKAALIAAGVAAIGLLSPWLVGAGEFLGADILLLDFAVPALLVIVGVRFLLGPVSYATGVPGGLFAPLLALAAAIGVTFATLLNDVWPVLGLQPQAFGIAAMGALFTAVVKSPLTGMMIAIELTGSLTSVLPIIVAAGVAYLVGRFAGTESVYERLQAVMSPAADSSVVAR